VQTALGYARISKDDQARGLGVTRQREDIEKLCAREKCRLEEMYVDNDLSASRYSRKPRPDYQRMLERLRDGGINKVVVYDLDRLLRQPRELEDLIDLADRTPDLTIHSYSGGLVNLETSDGRFVARILVAKAAKESDDLSRRIKRQVEQAAEFGQPSGGGRRPLGFATNRIDHHPTEAPALREAATMILAGSTLADAARYMLSVGAMQGRLDSCTSVLKRALCLPRAAGLRQHHGEIVGDAVWEPIIDRADWERLRAVLLRPSRYSVPLARHLLTGFAKCGECGAGLSAQIRKHERGRVIYQCRSRRGGCGRVSVDGGQLERLVLFEVGVLFRSKKVRRVAERYLTGDVEDRETELLATLDADQQRLTELAARVGELEITPPEWQAMRRPILDRLDATRAELGRTNRRPRARKVDLADLNRRWETMTTEEHRAWLKLFGIEAVVAKAGRQARRFNRERVSVLPGWART
jgi:site-specific DNA recombinase